MKRFRFSLEKVLRLRSQETEQAKRALAVALAAEARARQTAAEAHATLRDRTTEATARERLGLTAYEFGSLRTFLARLQREAVAADLAVTQAEERTQRQRMALLAARRRERAMEKLKERRLEQYQLEALREEQKELDEYGNRPGLNSSGSEPDI
jgi:flagellar FliJ protein